MSNLKSISCKFGGDENGNFSEEYSDEEMATKGGKKVQKKIEV